MKRVLVTGAKGFIGQACLSILPEYGYEVHAVSSHFREETGLSGHVYWHQADLLDDQQRNSLISTVRPKYLLHLAWYTEPGHYWNAPENLDWVGASLKLVQAFVQHGGERAALAGTCAEYDWAYGYCSELTTPTRPTTLYGTCKQALQSIIANYAYQAGLSAVWGRVFWLYGPHEHPTRLVASIVSNLLMGQAVPYSHGQQIRDYLHVADAATAFVKLLDSKIEGIVNIASGQPIQLNQIVDTITRYLGQPELVQQGAIATPVNEAPLVVADVRRLVQATGWKPFYDLESGLVQTINWWENVLRGRKQL